MEFPVVDLASWTRGEWEPGGDEEKRWFIAPPDGAYEGRWLFKPRREKELILSEARRERGDAPDILIRGEDWAEKVAYEVAKTIEIPAARTELATTVRRRDSQAVTGSMSRDFRPRRWQRSPGAALLDEHDEEFDRDTCRGHSLAGIRTVLDGVHGPPESQYANWAAFDVFAGYLLFDAWIANTDRHPLNWAVIQSPDGSVHLSPSFDHGSAFGSGGGEGHIATTLASGVENWCTRGRATRFDTAGITTLVDLAGDALGLAGPAAREHWRRQIAQVEAVSCDNIVARIPKLSESTRSFICEVLNINRRRLLDVT